MVPYQQLLGAEEAGGQVTVSFLAPKSRKDNNTLKLQTTRGQVQAGAAAGATAEWCEAALAKAYEGQYSHRRTLFRRCVG